MVWRGSSIVVLCIMLMPVPACTQVPAARPDPYTNTFVDPGYQHNSGQGGYRDNDSAYAPPRVIYRDNEVYMRVPNPAAPPMGYPPRLPQPRQGQAPVRRDYYRDNDSGYVPPDTGGDLLHLMDEMQ